MIIAVNDDVRITVEKKIRIFLQARIEISHCNTNFKAYNIYFKHFNVEFYELPKAKLGNVPNDRHSVIYLPRFEIFNLNERFV